MTFHEGQRVRLAGENITAVIVGSGPVEVLVEEGDLDGPTRTLSVSRDGVTYDVWMVREDDSGINRFFPEVQLEIL